MKAYVISGGGAKGAYCAGVLDRLSTRESPPEYIYGTSVGALNAVGYVYGGPEMLQEIWLHVRHRYDLFNFHFRDLFRGRFQGWYDTRPLRKIVRHVLCQSPYYASIPYVCYVDLYEGTLHYQSPEDRHAPLSFEDAVLASCSVPGLIQPIQRRYVDGGVREPTPLYQALEHGATDITMILTNPLGTQTAEMSRYCTVLTTLIQTLTLYSHEIYMTDCLLLLKELAPKITIYAPLRSYIGMLDFTKSAIAYAYTQGLHAQPLPQELWQEAIHAYFTSSIQSYSSSVLSKT